MKDSLIPYFGKDLRASMAAIQKEAENMIDRFMDSEILDQPFPFLVGRHGYPKLNVQTLDTQYLILAALPGYAKDELELELKKVEDGHVLTIKGSKKSQLSESLEYNIHEIKSSQFCRSLLLPQVSDETVDAELKDGILTIKIPRAGAPKPAPTKIAIK